MSIQCRGSHYRNTAFISPCLFIGPTPPLIGATSHIRCRASLAGREPAYFLGPAWPLPSLLLVASRQKTARRDIRFPRPRFTFPQFLGEIFIAVSLHDTYGCLPFDASQYGYYFIGMASYGAWEKIPPHQLKFRTVWWYKLQMSF